MILLPNLDTRDWDQLIDEGRRELPRLDGNWTDYNASDPGITALEAFAWITETALYRSDRSPPALLRSFLRLLGYPQAEATAAETVLSIALAAPGPTQALPAGLQIGAGDGGEIFETTQALTVSPAALATILVDAGDGTALSPPDPGPLVAFGHTPGPGSALYLGFDALLGAGGTPVRLFVWGEDFPADRAVPAAIDAERKAWAAACRTRCGDPGPVTLPPPWQEHYGARVVWEYRRGDGSWRPLTNVFDGTRALTLSGAISFDAPPEAGPDAHAAGGPDPALFFLRCRLAEGGYDRPPRLLGMALNAVAARHAALRPEVRLAESNGAAGERYWLPERPILADSLRLRMHRSGADDFGWRAAPDLDLSGPFDRHVALDAPDGSFRLGDGRQGAPIPAGSEVFAGYRLGGGPAGNVAAGALDRIVVNDRNAALVASPSLLDQAIVITQPRAATGGRARESIADARARAILALETSDKAVTPADFQRHALATPGVPLARARAVPGLHPLLPTVHAAGCVSVVLLPDADGPAPEPSAALRTTVARYLERRRLIATELHVIGPTWRDLAVIATLHLVRGADPATVEAEAARCLDAMFHPLSGGDEGLGWPPGADVHAADVMARLEALEPVDGVTDLALEAGEPPCLFCDSVPLCPGELIRVRPHRLTGVTPTGSKPAKDPRDGCC